MSDEPKRSDPAADRQALRSTATDFISKLKKGQFDFEVGLKLAEKLRDHREFDLLDQLTTQLRRAGDQNPIIRRLQAQSLIERGSPDAALDVLAALVARLSRDSKEWAEGHGLMGRAWKQILFDTDDCAGSARVALANSIREYTIPYTAAPRENVWHGLNLLALADFSKAKGLPVDPVIDSQRLARDIISTLAAKPEGDWDNWHHGSLAEAYLALGDLDRVEEHIGMYVRDPKTTAFALGGTLRQFTDLWLLERKSEREYGIVQSLRAALTSKEGFDWELSSEQMLRAFGDKPSDKQLESILGPDGPRTYKWFQLGLECGKAVGVICQGDIARVGSGFLINGSDFNLAWAGQPLLLTNAHVVSDDPKDEGIMPQDACIKFEAVDRNKSYGVEKQIVWKSGANMHDAAILRLNEPVEGISPLQHTPLLPLLDGKQRVYVIGYPGGGELSISFQDNILLDHEGPPAGTPVDPNICRIQYRAPTEKGSSGSPVFNGSNWRVVALHHAGGESIRRLNRRTEQWPANEGIWIKSIIDATAKSHD